MVPFPQADALQLIDVVWARFWP